MFSGAGRISKYYHLLIDFCVPVYYESRGNAVVIHTQEINQRDPRRLGSEGGLPGDLSREKVFSILETLFEDITFVANPANKHSSIWQTKDQQAITTLPSYIHENEYGITNIPKHRGVWSNYPSEYYNIFRNHVYNITGNVSNNCDQVTILLRDPETSEFRGDNKKQLEDIYNYHKGINSNVKFVDFAKLSLIEQINECKKTKLLVGEHGAGLSNAIFMKPGSSLHELGEIQCPCFKILATQCGIKYKNINK